MENKELAKQKLEHVEQQLEELAMEIEVAFGLLLLRRHRMTAEEIEAEELRLSDCQRRYFEYRKRAAEAVITWPSG